jgi:hypothetical protein
MRRLLLSTLLLNLSGCAVQSFDDAAFVKVEEGKADTSAEAIIVDMTFDGELIASSSWNPEQQIEDQLLYTIGHINGSRGVARLDQVELGDVSVTPEGTRYLIRYTARLPVAWPRRTTVPHEYTLKLPRDMTYAALERFATSYGRSCVDIGAHDVTSGSMWYYYRPNRTGCSIASSDLVTTVADVQLSDVNTTGRFPEYDQVWEDGALRVVAIFGKYEDGATTSSDAGIEAYNRFLSSMRTELSSRGLTTVPSSVPSNPGVSVPDVTFRATLATGRTIEVVALLVDNVRTAGATFDARYAELSTRADIIVYNGHAGLGANIRALASKGRWTEGQYAIVFMNGCDTYAYVDTALWDAHARVNPDDPTGTKHLDIVMNAMPAFFRSMPAATMALIRGMMSYSSPRTYEQIFANVDSQQMVLVSGEQDNTFTPGGTGGTTAPSWAGMNERGNLTRGQEVRFATTTLAPGRYRFVTTGTGDADLYVRIGSAPTMSTYDCRPYRSDANETCEVTLAASAPVHVMMHGYSASSYTLTGTKL